MREKLKYHINLVFQGAPDNKKINELKEELLQNLYDKYDDLISEGKSSEEAYNCAIRSIGDVSEIIEQLSREENKNYNSQEARKYKKQSAILISISAALYIICVIPVILLQNEIGVIAMFVIVALATGLIIYNSMSKPDYIRIKEKTEDGKDDKYEMLNIESKRKMNLVNSIMWPLIVVAYLLISFKTGAWYITWIVFPIGGVVESIIKAIFELKQGGHDK